jgi:hypothetical protein
MAPQPPPETPLQKHLRRMMEALAEGQRHHAQWKERWERQHAQEMEQWARQFGQEMEQWGQHFGQDMQQWARHLGRKHRRRWEKRMQRQAWRDARRAMKQQRHHEEANPFMGWVFALAAVVMVGMAATRRELWWLVFVALGMGSAAAGILGNARKVERERLEEGAREGTASREDARGEVPEKKPEAPRPVEEDPRTARVDGLCDKLLAELRAGPGVLRDVVHQPEQTVEGLRKSCHELARRERELRALSSPEDERRLEEERARVVARVESERDAVVKERLEGALLLLDEQRRQRAELVTAASRLEAEHMRLSYTLENLYTQVLRVRSADAASADVAGAGLRRSVEQLGLEMDAVAEALEEVHRDGAPPTRVPTR